VARNRQTQKQEQQNNLKANKENKKNHFAVNHFAE